MLTGLNSELSAASVQLEFLSSVGKLTQPSLALSFEK